MQRASALFSSEDRQRVNQAVGSAESRTSAEIVAAVATASGRYDRAEDIVGLWIGLAALAICWALWPAELHEAGGWNESSPAVQLVAMLAAVVVGFIVGAAVATHVGWLRRWFTPRKQMREEVAARSRQTFCDRRVYRTTGTSGLLVYISLFERMATIVADDAIVEKLGQRALDELCRELTGKLRGQDPTSALCSTIEAAGQRLASCLPRAADDVNELDDSLVVLD
jgi:putative membrane protein